MRSLILMIAATGILSGCVTVGGDPLLRAMRDPPTPVGCPTPDATGAVPAGVNATDPNDNALCNAILHTIYTARGVRNGALSLDNAQAGLGGVQIASGVASAGFAMFEAHPDNILAATLAGGAALAARSGLKPQERRDVLRGGARALSCVAERGSVFMGAAGRAAQLQTLTVSVAEQSLRLRGMLSNRRGSAEERAQLEAALTRLDTANTAARANVGPMLSAPAQVNDTRRLVERNIERQLATLQPDIAAIVEAIGKLAPEPATPGSPPASTGLREMLVERPDNLRRATEIASALAAYLESLEGPGQEEYAAIAACATEL